MTHYSTSQWRVIFSGQNDGAMNMALDEAIMLQVAGGQSPPTVRFYGWHPPCLSLGYAQSIADVDAARLRQLGYSLVRRPTGGKAILHTDELTYSIAALQIDPRMAGGIVESYQRLSGGLMQGLVTLGLSARNDNALAPDHTTQSENPVCFVTPSHYEITANNKKLIGSAQARKKGAVLQHGSLPLQGDIARICEVLAFDSDSARDHAKQQVRQRAATLFDALGRIVTWQAAADAMAHGLASALSLTLTPASPSADELALARQLRAEKYSVVQ